MIDRLYGHVVPSEVDVNSEDFTDMSTHLPKQNELHNFLMSEECLRLGQLVANMS